MQDRSEIAAAVAKVATVWAAVGITSWADAASFLAAIYTAMLICEWLWKRVFKPIAVREGWLKP
jgi:hypothetical protein